MTKPKPTKHEDDVRRGLRTAQYNGIIDTQLKVIDELKAEVERLRKAGDELHAFLINYIVDSRISSAYLNKLDDGWNAAKEGKPEEIEVGDIIYVNGTKCRVLWCDPTEYGMRLTLSEDAYSKRAAKEGKPSV